MKKTLLLLSIIISSTAIAQTQQTEKKEITINLTLTEKQAIDVYNILTTTKLTYGEAAPTIDLVRMKIIQQQDSVKNASIIKPKEIKKP